MAFDFKREYKEFYMPKNRPEIVTVPKANYIAGRGKGNPNEEGGAYQQAIGVLYAVAYTLKMSYKTDHRIDGFFEYVVPPLEGFWWQENTDGVDYNDKSAFNWISVIRLPDFVTKIFSKSLYGGLEFGSRRYCVPGTLFCASSAAFLITSLILVDTLLINWSNSA